MSGEGWLSDWDALVAAGDNSKLEEYWLARVEQGVADSGTFLEALRRLRSAGKKTLAATLLELGEVEAASRRDWRARLAFLRELLRLGIGDAGQQRADLEECCRHLGAGRPSLEAFLAHFQLRSARNVVEAIDALQTWLAHDVGTVVAMTGRGAGRVSEANPKLGVLRVDFERERRVPVPIDAAARYLTPLPPGHFLRRRLEDPQGVARAVRDDPAGAVEAILSTVGSPLGVGDIKAAVEGLVGADEWSAWWARARKNPRLLASGSGTRIQYRLASAEGGAGIEGEILAEFEAAPLSKRVELARRHGGRSPGLAAAMASGLVAGAAAAEAGEAWEALAQAERLGGGEEVVGARAALAERFGVATLLDRVTDAQQRLAVLTFARARRPDWNVLYAERLAAEEHPRVLTALAVELLDGGDAASPEAFLDQVFLQPLRHPAALVWACEETASGPLGAMLDARRTGALLVRLVELAERDEFGPYRARLRAVLAPDGLAGPILQDRLTLEQARRLLQVLERPGEMSEARDWLRRALPARFAALREEPGDRALPVLAGTVPRLQGELRDLLERQIPETLRAIQVAREHGDLRENFEYHAARARQELLSARAARLQADIGRLRVIDPAKLDLAVVRVGARVALRAAEGDERRTVAILGPYEADPDAGVLSNESEAAGALLGRAVGAEVQHDGRAWRVESIAAYVPSGGDGSDA